ncbi:hypothetical protein SAMN04488695_103138 [Proteiniclasticum ruminis]|uniref:Uncharacterized protein n=1 Tax=Proteiniclasticum ruminis TaxID=398199 RepID=A0A1I5AQI2_9CLOT|nr:hypothetical protein SAMN04488695_103138 [Proteiniclasticum ruminis]
MEKSIEPATAGLGNSWLKSYGLNNKLEQDALSSEIDKVLIYYFTKNRGGGHNRPDAKSTIYKKKTLTITLYS